MNRISQTAAWQQIRACTDVNAGRLTGRVLRYQYLSAILPGTLAPAAAQQLHASAYRRHSEPATPDTIWYVVSSDGTPVAWLTLDATVVTPPADLTTYQLQHQEQAVTALSNLTRQALLELAQLRDTRDHRTPGDPRQEQPGSHGDEIATRILVADPADPTLSFWVRAGADLDTTRLHVAEVTGVAEGNDALILDVRGYGDYGRSRAVLDLSVLCAVEHLAAVNELPAEAIGTWLHLDGATTGNPTADEITTAFGDAYAGVHDSRRAFAITERDRYGWTTALANAGKPDRYFNLDAFTEHLFRTEVHKVPLDDGRIAVFRRG
ncbi:hypothetical protein [Dactylosporangium darangshiense]|uniref:Uncharacterized protein n=1 Tax=Dactylosporangium darangshiense TaxID=579108 RepID=A0ABP8DMX3_9ACTN